MSYENAASLSHTETEPLLQSYERETARETLQEAGTVEHRPPTDSVPNDKRQLGLLSTTSLIFNGVIGTGAFAAPGIILNSSGSVGMSLVMWILGALVAAAGMAVYIEFGTGLPQNGGEKNYVEYVFRHPPHMITCFYAAYGVFIGWLAAGSIAFGEYTLHAMDCEQTPSNIRLAALLCATFCLVVHGAFPEFGVKFQDALGAFKFFVLTLIAVSGFLSMAGVPGFIVGEEYDQPNNYTWQTFWEGTNYDPNALTISMYNVIWSYMGYVDANYALSEVRDPVKTMKVAAPFAICLVTFVYVSVNMAYFAVVSKTDMLHGGVIPAALFFRNLFGPATERILSIIISLSILGNLLSVLFTQSRVVQELGREGVLPYSSFFASNKPFGIPLPGLFTQYLVSVLLVVLAQPGDAYLFTINFPSYSAALLNLLVSGGLLLLYTDAFKSYNWNPPFRAHKFAIVLFFLSNVFLVVVPLIPPTAGHQPYEHLPYYSHVAFALFIGLLGVMYWFIIFWWIPRKNGYMLVQVTVIQDGDVSCKVFQPIPIEREQAPQALD